MGCPRPNTPRSDPYDLGQLERVLGDRLYTLFHDAPNRGLTLVSGYRDPGRQWDIRTPDRGIPAGQQCNPAYKGRPPTATPAVWNGKEWVGGSDHQRRTAADIGGRDLQWAIDNRARYGLGLTVRTENWHNKAFGIDARTGRPIPNPTVRILTYPGKRWDGPAAPASTVPAFPGVALYGGVSHKAVAQWKVMLRSLGYQRFDTSAKGINTFSRGLVAATKRFQRNNGLVADGVVGPATWAKAAAKIDAKAKG